MANDKVNFSPRFEMIETSNGRCYFGYRIEDELSRWRASEAESIRFKYVLKLTAYGPSSFKALSVKEALTTLLEAGIRSRMGKGTEEEFRRDEIRETHELSWIAKAAERYV